MASSITEGAADLETEMWKLPGLQSEQFFAAAYYLSVVQRQQKSSTNATPAFDVDSSETTPHETTNLFLDLLSLLFSRFKRKNKTPANVTASAMILERNCWKILIAKNAGPSSQGPINDEDFANRLQAWMNREPTVPNKLSHVVQGAMAISSTLIGSRSAGSPEPNDQLWGDIVQFWDERITHYVKGVQNGASLLPLGQSTTGSESSVQEISFVTIEEFAKIKMADIDVARLQEDWNRVVQMSKSLGNPNNGSYKDGNSETSWIVQPSETGKGKKKIKGPEAASSKLCFAAFEECFQFRNRKTRQAYPFGKDQDDSAARAYNQFRKRVKDLEMIGTISTIWKVLNQIRDELREKNIKVNIEFVPAFPEFSLEKLELVRTIQGWSGLEKSSHRNKILDELKAGSTQFKKYFHCELQLLRVLHNEEAAGKSTHPYIGVSKLSCHFCAEILSNGKAHKVQYRTRDGHHQISANCAFPFDIAGGYGYIPEALAQLQGSMLRRILQEAVRIKIKYTAYSNMDQTDLVSIPGSFASQSAQRSIKRVLPSQLQTKNDGSILVEGLRLGADGHESREYVRILFETSNRSHAAGEPHKKKPIPECVKYKKGDGRWCEAGLRVPASRGFLEFEVYYRLNGDLGNHPGNEWAFKRTAGIVKSRREIDNALFRGDIWVFKVDRESPLRYQHIFSQRNADDVDFYEFQEQEFKNVVDEDTFFESRTKDEIERHLVLHLRHEYDLDQEQKARNDMVEQETLKERRLERETNDRMFSRFQRDRF